MTKAILPMLSPNFYTPAEQEVVDDCLSIPKELKVE